MLVSNTHCMNDMRTYDINTTPWLTGLLGICILSTVTFLEGPTKPPHCGTQTCNSSDILFDFLDCFGNQSNITRKQFL